MGPRCPNCGAVYEWSCGEIEEHAVAPRFHFCEQCRSLFVLTAEEVQQLQEKLRPHLRNSTAPADHSDAPGERHGGAPRLDPRLDRAPPAPASDASADLRGRVLLRAGPYSGATGSIAVISGDDALVRLDGGRGLVRVPLDQLDRV